MKRIAVVVGNGMCEGFSRVRRGINGVRSPRGVLLVTTWLLESPRRLQRKTYEWVALLPDIITLADPGTAKTPSHRGTVLRRGGCSISH